MTQLNEVFTVRMSLEHDKLDGISKVYGGTMDLEEAARELLPALTQFIGMNGKGKLEFNGILVEWEYTGLQEVPEEGGGDN